MTLLDRLKAAFSRLRSAPTENDGPAPYRTIEVRLPAELEPALALVKDQHVARLTQRGVPMASLSDEATVLSCIAGMAASYRVIEQADPSAAPQVH